MNLSGQQRRQLVKVLLGAFPTHAKLRQMVSYGLNKHLDTIAIGDDLEEIVFKIIVAAEAQGWTPKLILAARELNPGNPQLFAFSQQYGLASTSLSRPELERTIDKTKSFLDVAQWRTKLERIEHQVCRVEVTVNGGQGSIFGTGFLLGPDVLMTNYHVMEAVIEGEIRQAKGQTPWAKSEDVLLRFDFKRMADGKTLNFGRECHLAEDWLIDASPLSPTDRELEPKTKCPEHNQLDYALLRLAEEVGAQAIGTDPYGSTPPRGWIEIPEETYDFQIDSPLFIVQHPKSRPLKLAFDTKSVIGLNSNRTRVKYRTNTEPGSSGSPCFNANWEVVALHHAGDPDFSLVHKPTYNQGIPLAAILHLLEERGLRNILGSQAI